MRRVAGRILEALPFGLLIIDDESRFVLPFIGALDDESRFAPPLISSDDVRCFAVPILVDSPFTIPPFGDDSKVETTLPTVLFTLPPPSSPRNTGELHKKRVFLTPSSSPAQNVDASGATSQAVPDLLDPRACASHRRTTSRVENPRTCNRTHTVKEYDG